MAIIRIAMLQMIAVGIDVKANLEIADAACREAKQQGADVALMPEMWSIGYTRFAPDSDVPYEDWLACAQPADGPFVSHFEALAQALDMAIGVALLEAWPGAPRNTLVLVDRHGKRVLTYAKVHTSDFKRMEASMTPGDDFPVCELDTAVGPVAVGSMICFDREQPESARCLMLNGAELVLVPNACTIEDCRSAQLKTRAYENMMAVAMANYARPQQNGHSQAYGADGSLLVQAGETEGVYIAELDLEALRAHRAHGIWGNAYRRPHRYGILVSNEVRAPFERTNGLGERFEREER